MPNIACPIPPNFCPDPGLAISNFSSEDPDQDLFIARNYGGTFHGGGGFRFSSPSPGPGAPPPLSGGGSADSGNGGTFFQCEALTQEEADLCAYNGQFQALNNSWGAPQTGPFGDGDWGNNAQTAMAACGTTATVPANTFFLGSQALADAQALKYAQQLAVNKQSCFNVSQSCTVECADGTPFTSTVEAGICSGFTAAIANQIAHTIACNSAIRDQICFSELFQDVACTGTNYSALINATGGPLILEISGGSLPPGVEILSQGPTTMLLGGTPTAAGDYTFTIRGTNIADQSSEKTYTIAVKGITPDVLANAEVGRAYSQQFTFTGATGAVTWSSVGNIPGGLTLSPDGLLSGTPECGTIGPWVIEAIAQDDSTTCQLGIPLTVVHGCVQWQDAEWLSPPYGSAIGAGSFSAVFGTGVVPTTFFVQAISPAGAPDTADAGANTPGLTYNGPACDCVCHFVVSATGVPVTQYSWVVAIQTTLGILVNKQSGVDAEGTYDIQFTIPDTGGMNIHVQITVGVTSGGGFVPSSATISGYVQSVC